MTVRANISKNHRTGGSYKIINRGASANFGVKIDGGKMGDRSADPLVGSAECGFLGVSAAVRDEPSQTGLTQMTPRRTGVL